YYLDVYPALATSGPCPTATATPSATASAAATPSPTATPTAAPLVCGAAPRGGCRAPAVSGAARLQIRNAAADAKDRLQWKWLKGAATLKADFGDPTT